MLIPLAVMNLPWVILGQVSKTLLTNRTHLAQEQLEATWVLFCQFDRREEETPSPSEATGREGGGTHGPRRSGKPRDQGRAREHPQGARGLHGGPRSPRGSAETAELPQAHQHARVSFPSLPQQITTNRMPQHKESEFLPSDVGNQGAGQRWFLRGALDKNSFPPPANPVFASRTILLPPKALSHPLPLRRLDPVESTCITLSLIIKLPLLFNPTVQDSVLTGSRN